MKFAFEALDLKNFNSFEAPGLRYGNPRFLNAGVATSASGLSCVSFFGRGSKIRPRSDLRWLNPRLKFTTSTRLPFSFYAAALTEF